MTTTTQRPHDPTTPRPTPCRLIVTADDFGRSPGVNAAVIEAHRDGSLTSCSLMVAEPAAAEAVARAREHPDLAVGLHLTFLHGRPALPAERLPALVDRDGLFPADPLRTGLRIYFSSAARRHVRCEMEAQFERFAATGLPLSHVDAHLHFHLHPVVFGAALDLALRYGCRRIRIPLDSWALYRRIDPLGARRQVPLAAIFAVLCARRRRAARARGIGSPDYCFGLFRTGRVDASYLAALVRMLPPGTHELHCHPDRDTAAGRRELEALLSSDFSAARAERGVELVSYPALDLR